MNYRFELDQRQKDRLQAWIKRHRLHTDPDECCFLTANYHFEITPSGIGDSVIAVAYTPRSGGGHNRVECNLTIDVDDELVPE